MRIGTSPTSTTRPLRRVASKALFSRPGSPPAAVTITASAPRPVGALQHAGHEVALGDGEALVEAERRRPLDAVGPHVDADRHGAGGAQHLHGDLAEQAEAEHRDAVAEADLRAPHALQRDRAERAEGGLLERDAVRDARHQVARHDVDAGVVRVAGAGAGHAVADVQVR